MGCADSPNAVRAADMGPVEAAVREIDAIGVALLPGPLDGGNLLSTVITGDCARAVYCHLRRCEERGEAHRKNGVGARWALELEGRRAIV